MRIPCIRLDPSIPEHAALWNAYQAVSRSGRSEWVRLKMLAGVFAGAAGIAAQSLHVQDASDAGRKAAGEGDNTVVKPFVPPIPPMF